MYPSCAACSSPHKAILDEADAFRRERLRRITRREVRPDAVAASQLFVHVLRLGRLDQLLDLPSVADRLNLAAPLLGASGWSDGYDADGYWTYNRKSPFTTAAALQAYSQRFRFGGAEPYSADVTDAPTPHNLDGPRVFNGRYYVGALRSVLPSVLNALAGTLAVDPPYLVTLSLRGLRGTAMLRYRTRPARTTAVRVWTGTRSRYRRLSSKIPPLTRASSCGQRWTYSDRRSERRGCRMCF
jgi:hypothetical protein